MYRAIQLTAVLFMFPISVVAHAVDLPTEQELINGAAARIEKHRKADLTVKVVDADGKPIPNATVHLTQTRHAFLFGSNIYAWGKFNDPQHEKQYRDRFAEVFNFATIGFYWWAYERDQGKPIHEKTEAVARWCIERGITPKGHPLAWNYHEPTWLPNDPDEVLRLQMARIDDCVKRFRGLIDIWDVVNEPVHYERDHFLKRSPKLTAAWEKAGRVGFSLECFRHARANNPKATLLINDYRTDSLYEKVIEGLVGDDGKPVYDKIGIQSHMHGGVWSNRKIWEVCQRYSCFGAPLHFTEATIISGEPGWRSDDHGKPWPSTKEGEVFQAREVERFYTMLFSHPRVEAITWWDFCDAKSWKQAPAGFLRTDLTEKPAYTALKRLIKEDWWTDETTQTNDQGVAQIRAFKGDFELTVTAPGVKPTNRKLTVGKDSAVKVTVVE
jgi:endo-1,4-beta-xylanase